MTFLQRIVKDDTQSNRCSFFYATRKLQKIEVSRRTVKLLLIIFAIPLLNEIGIFSGGKYEKLMIRDESVPGNLTWHRKCSGKGVCIPYQISDQSELTDKMRHAILRHVMQ